MTGCCKCEKGICDDEVKVKKRRVIRKSKADTQTKRHTDKQIHRRTNI